MDIHALGLSRDLAQVEELLRQAVESNVPVLRGAGEHIIGAGGKRLRPLIALCAFRALGGQDAAQVARLAAAVELLHTASLIHDDINDHADTRRGRPTINSHWGNTLALLAGDFVFVRMVQTMAGCGAPFIQIIGDACQALVEGETLQLLTLWDLDLGEERYLEMVELKTAALFAACAQLGGLAAGGAAEQVAALRAYGLNLGMAFQLCDDALDLVGVADALGKPTAHDLPQGKLSLAVLYALRRSEEAAQALRARDVALIRRILHQTQAVDYALDKAEGYAEMAEAALAPLAESRFKLALAELARLAARREC